TLRELTLLATDDQATADLVCSRWIFFEPNPDVLRQAVIKMNWLEQPQPAAAPPPQAAEPESDGFSQLELTSTK
ncbi:MAG: hypothetical protein KC910_20365, partial [Candidatus Eremiobacteraeota bacterium]|nr:hypothetical protein [Candidatus Eremiobacteraeota bacterium]